MSATDPAEVHGFVGRVAAVLSPHMLSFCQCGLGFYGRNEGESDDRLEEHVNSQRPFEVWLFESPSEVQSPTDLDADPRLAT